MIPYLTPDEADRLSTEELLDRAIAIRQMEYTQALHDPHATRAWKFATARRLKEAQKRVEVWRDKAGRENPGPAKEAIR